MSQPEKELLLKLSRENIPVSVLMNCSLGRREERWIPLHEINLQYVKECENWFSAINVDPVPIAGKKVYLCNFLFYWSQMPDFALSMPDIDRPDSVQRHIISTLQEEGYKTDRETIRKLSGVDELVDTLTKLVRGYDPITHQIGGRRL